jgi:hypothetical protein
MRRATRCIVLLGIAALVAAGCGGGPPPTPTLSPATSGPSAAPVPTGPSGSPEPTADAVQRALLGPADLGASYVVVPNSVSPVTGMNGALRDCAGIKDSSERVVSAQVALHGSAIGPFASETIEVSTQAEAARQISGLGAVLKNCDKFGDGVGAGMTVAFEPLSLTTVGDEMRSFRMTAGTKDITAVYAHLVVVRIGNVIVRFTVMQFMTPDPAQTQHMVEVAVAKARSLISR